MTTTVIVKYFQNEGRFEPLVPAVEEEISIDIENDYLIRKAEFLRDFDEIILRRMFRKYNSDDRPDGKERRSMSIGDVVSVDGRAYCCNIGSWDRL